MRELTISEVQNYYYQIIKYVDKICRKENIQYFLAYGTLLGAIREEGFIPWDVDMDIWMKREDYEKFMNVIPKYTDEKFFLQNYKTDPYFPVPELSRICVNGTMTWNRISKNIKFHTGIFLDIFPLDFSSKNISYVKNKKRNLSIMHHIVYNIAIDYQASKTIRGFLYKTFLKVVPYKAMLNRIIKRMRKNKEENRKMLISYAGHYELERGMFCSEWFEGIEYRKFGDLQLPCPTNYDMILRTIYGDDYMVPVRTKDGNHRSYLL